MDRPVAGFPMPLDRRPAVSPSWMPSPPRPRPGPPERPPGRKLLRLAVNVWLVFHLAAIIIAPAVGRPRRPSSSTPPGASSSPISRSSTSTTATTSSPPSPSESTAPGVRGRAARRDRRPRADPRPLDPAAAALPPLFHADRAHDRGGRGAPASSGTSRMPEHIGREHGATQRAA